MPDADWDNELVDRLARAHHVAWSASSASWQKPVPWDALSPRARSARRVAVRAALDVLREERLLLPDLRATGEAAVPSAPVARIPHQSDRRHV